MSLYQRHRPTTFDEIVGAKMQDVVSELRPLLASDDPPHAYLLHGSSGCGKTTLGRILCRELGVVGDDYEEKDSADFRGIDTIRDMRRLSFHRPMHGKRRAYLLDECFAAGTLVSISGGEVPIETVKPGDSVISLVGLSRVENVFRNVVSLDRVVRLCLSNGRRVFTTVDHLFLDGANKNWIKAGLLVPGNLLSSLSSGIVYSTNSLGSDNVYENVSGVRNTVRNSEFNTDVLQSRLRECTGGEKAYWTKAIRGNASAFIRNTYAYPQYGSGSRDTSDALGTHAGAQSIYAVGGSREGESHEAYQGHSQCMEGGARGEREVDCTAEVDCRSSRMAYGSSDYDWTQPAGREWISNVLQGRYRESCAEAGRRGRRSCSPVEERCGNRREEGAEAGDVRVESIEIYQRGRNDGYFGGVIGDRERDCGFVVFHDLQVADDPSYYAEGVAVHNCHKLTNEAMNALLKGLEDPPPHAYFVLCTTDPDKLLSTIRGRCVQFQVHPLEEREMVRHLHSVARAEGVSVDREVLRAIADKSDGHSRDALQILEKVLVAPPDRHAALVDDVATVRAATQRLARTLLESSGWRKVTDELTRIAAQEWREDDEVKAKARGKPRSLDDYDLEQIRRGVLAYCGKVLLGGENDVAADIINEFRSPFFESGMAGLILACYGVVKS